MPAVLVRPRAQADIEDIWDYIANDSVAQADAFVDRLSAKLQLLAMQPDIGRLRSELAPMLRSFPFGRYMIYFEPHAHGIAVVRVLHSARDPLAAFSKPDG